MLNLAQPRTPWMPTLCAWHNYCSVCVCVWIHKMHKTGWHFEIGILLVVGFVVIVALSCSMKRSIEIRKQKLHHAVFDKLQQRNPSRGASLLKGGGVQSDSWSGMCSVGVCSQNKHGQAGRDDPWWQLQSATPFYYFVFLWCLHPLKLEAQSAGYFTAIQ